jgi:hypothetical protein
MPGPRVHLQLTRDIAIQEGLDPEDASALGYADLQVDDLWPGSRIWRRHFNPSASLVFGPLELARAVRAERGGDRALAMTHLGRSLHSHQDAIGHGRLGLNHLAWDLGLLKRDPDDWDLMPPRVKARIERVTRRTLRRYLRRTGGPA